MVDVDLNPGHLAPRSRWRVAPSHTPSSHSHSHHLPHDPGDQHHGGIIEGVEEVNEQLSLRPQLPQGHTKDYGKHHQAQDVHTLHLIPDRYLWLRNRWGRELVA